MFEPPPVFGFLFVFEGNPCFLYRFSLQYVSMPTTDIPLIGRGVGWGDGTYDRGGHRTSTFLSRILPGVDLTEGATSGCVSIHELASGYTRDIISSTLELWKTCLSILLWSLTSSTTQGGGGSFKNRKPIGEFGCCESRMAERRHWWMDRFCLFLSFSLTIYLHANLRTYPSINLSG